jgi:hypothetical protein
MRRLFSAYPSGGSLKQCIIVDATRNQAALAFGTADDSIGRIDGNFFLTDSKVARSYGLGRGRQCLNPLIEENMRFHLAILSAAALVTVPAASIAATVPASTTATVQTKATCTSVRTTVPVSVSGDFYSVEATTSKIVQVCGTPSQARTEALATPKTTSAADPWVLDEILDQQSLTYGG